MQAIVDFFNEIIDLIKLLWNLKTIIIGGIVVVVLFLFYDRILSVVAHHKEVFKGGRKDD